MCSLGSRVGCTLHRRALEPLLIVNRQVDGCVFWALYVECAFIFAGASIGKLLVAVRAEYEFGDIRDDVFVDC